MAPTPPIVDIDATARLLVSLAGKPTQNGPELDVMWGKCGDCDEYDNVHILVSRNVAGHPVTQPYPMCRGCRARERQALRLSGHTDIRVKGPDEETGE